jgi:spore coat protein U-like protein
MSRNRIVKHLSIWSLSAVALALAVPDAHAQSAASNFTVSAAVARTCSISTVNMNFGNYDPITTHATTPLDVNGSVTIACTRGTTTSIDLSPGANAASAVGTTRAMAGGVTPDHLSYELYQDNTFSTVWGVGNPGNAYVPPAAPSRAPRTYTIFGRIPAGQDSAVGNYSDTVTATVNF